MEDQVEYVARPGSLMLSVVSFIGLMLLSAALWQSMPGFVLLIMIPALAISLYQLVVTPEQGVRIGRSEWIVLGADGDRAIPSAEIAYLRVTGRGRVTRVTIVLQGGAEVDVPLPMPNTPIDLIRAATDRGVPVRTS